MAIQIKVVDTNLEEHYMVVNSYKDIYVSEDNSSRYKINIVDALEYAEEELQIP